MVLINKNVAQNFLIESNETIIGKNYITSTDIVAKEYLFSERIENLYLDSSNNRLSIKLRGKSKNGKWLDNTGYLLNFDCTNKKIIWSNEIGYGNQNILQANDVIIKNFSNKSQRLNSDNGEILWNAKNDIYYLNNQKKIGIGYNVKLKNTNSKTVEGINLVDGKSIWKREITRDYGWNSINILNDSTLIVVAAGLHNINIKNGSGWDFDTNTGTKDYTESAIKNVAGVALGVLTGTFVTSSGYNLLNDLVSNVLIDSNNIYFASMDEVFCLNLSGETKWIKKLPIDITSKSQIFLKDNFLYLINKGYAYMGNTQIEYGLPFIASFNKTSGEQIYLNKIFDKKNKLNDFKLYNNNILLIFKDKISAYSLSEGILLDEKLFDLDIYKGLRYFASKLAYIKSDSTYNCMISMDSSKHFLYSNSGKTIELSADLDIVSEFDVNDLYFHYYIYNGFKFLTHNNKTILLNNDNKKIADLNISQKLFHSGEKFYDFYEKTIVEIDLDKIIKN
jgi:PQQ-like domain